MLHILIPVWLIHHPPLQRLPFRAQQVLPFDLQGSSSALLSQYTHHPIPIWNQHISNISHPGHHPCTMVSRYHWESQLCSHPFQIRYQLWTYSSREPSRYPQWTPHHRGALLIKIQCSYWKNSPCYAIHPPWSHVCCQMSLQKWFFPIRFSLPM